MRSIRRKNEEAFWAFIPRQYSLMKISRAGTLDGVQVPSRHVLTATPYALVGSGAIFIVDPEAQERSEFGGEVRVGCDARVSRSISRTTPTSRRSRSTSTHQPHAVSAVLSREAAVLPRARGHLLGLGTPQAVDLFFTRRIGIDPFGQPVPIVGGGQLTRTPGGPSPSAGSDLHGGQRRSQEPMAYSVLRIGHEFATRSRVGVIGVQRVATSNPKTSIACFGVDGRIGIGDPWTIDWLRGRHRRDQVAISDAVAYSARLTYETRALV